MVQSRERITPTPTPRSSRNSKGTFRSPLTTVDQLIYIYIYKRVGQFVTQNLLRIFFTSQYQSGFDI